MRSFKRPIGASGAALALALVAAACSSGSTDTTATGSETASTAAETTEAAPATSESTESTESAASDDSAEPEAEVEGPTPAIEHSFPDLDTVTIGDGATVNLADELAGGDTPVLLWFFAPH
ncbi:MAG: hypothetical protein AAFO29_04355 [Actinomycetota bacterium]